ncbi:MAG: DUF305 domain-containing protein [Gammaproteobacteria bacterium]|nr:DUF305 domain-containing protein [Gammaproteobacteria bacterium]
MLGKTLRLAMSQRVSLGLVALFFAGTVNAQVPIIQPGAPGQPSRQISVEEASNLASLSFTDADVKFMQGMIMHHGQALEMAALVEARSAREALQLMALRISLSQEDEIAMMQDWLEARELPTAMPMADMQAMAANPDMMPGILTAAELAELEGLSFQDFDSRFLQLMIKHHEGAITMVERLLDQPGTAQDSVLFAFTTDVTSDQTSEIERMSAMLAGFSPDPRVGLKPGYADAGQAALNMRLLAALPKPDGFFDPANPEGLPMSRARPQAIAASEDGDTPESTGGDAESSVVETLTNAADEGVVPADVEDETAEPRPSLMNFANTDLLFDGDVVVAGNYHGFNAYDISDPRAPELLSSVVCPGGQGDVSIIGDLLIMSVEQTRGRLDCGLQGVAEPESAERFRGIRLFDISDFRMPIQVGAVQTCRGSHTHTVVTDPDDAGNVYVYGSGTSSVRPGEELEGCYDESPFENPESALFRIDVIQIPLNDPASARVVNRPTIFSDPDSGVIAGLWEGGDHGPGTQTTRQTNQCHDITAYPEVGLAAGACSGNGILIDISDPANPSRVAEVIDPGFAYWHSATFSNDGRKVVFTDEWGGGSRPRCRPADPLTWGADAIYDIVDNEMQFRGYFKMPAPQTDQENCVAHNGSLVPVPGRDIMVQAWYQGGISVFDFTDSANPKEIAFFDRGPVDAEELILGGYWSAYWFEGLIYGTEIARGFDVLELLPSDELSENEIAAASLRSTGGTFNAQRQQQHVWPAEPVVALAYRDQLVRSGVLSSSRSEELSAALADAQGLIDDVGRDARVAGKLRSLAVTFNDEAESARGVSRDRLIALSGSLEVIADRL